MRQYLPSFIWFSAGAVLGQFTESVLSPLWMRLGLLLPLGHWLDSFGNKSLDWCWLIVDIWLMSWLIAALVSVIGGFFIKRHVLSSLLLFGIGFAFVPLILHAFLYSHIPTFLDYMQHIIIFGVAAMCGFLGHRFALRHEIRAAYHLSSPIGQ